MPIFTTLGAWLLLGQRFQAKFLLGMAVAIAGAVTIAIEDLQVAGSHLTWRCSSFDCCDFFCD
jgi:drug/metabolite transporter (DMT)-like permease